MGSPDVHFRVSAAARRLSCLLTAALLLLSVARGAEDNIVSTSGSESAPAPAGGPSGTRHLLVSSFRCFISGCEFEDSVLRYDGVTGEYLGVHATGVPGAYGIAYRPYKETTLVVSRTNSTVEEFHSRTGAHLSTFITAGAEGLNSPQNILIDANWDVLLTSMPTGEAFAKFNGILKFDGDNGAFIAPFVNGGSILAETCGSPRCLRGANGMAFGPDGQLYVASSVNNSVIEYNGLTGLYLGVLDATELVSPNGLAVRRAGTGLGNILVTSVNDPGTTFDDLILQFSKTTRELVNPNGVFSTNMIDVGPLAWSVDDNLLAAERTGNIFPNYADRIAERSGTNGGSMGLFTASDDTHTHLATAMFELVSDVAGHDYDGDGDRDLRDMAAFQRCAGRSTSDCLAAFDDNLNRQIGLGDYACARTNLRGPRRPCTTPAQCVDNNPCMTDECVGGECVGSPVVDGAPCADALFCDGQETCRSGLCIGTRPCVDAAHCDEANDRCFPCLTHAECDDGRVCTNDTCVLGVGCQYSNNTASCSDGNFCTTQDRCSAGACVGGPAATCNDSNVCTDDHCDPAKGCQFVHNLAPCSDQDACTLEDSCLQGTCRRGQPLDCDDQSQCTTDSCVPTTGCRHVNNTGACNDFDVCTVNDFCSQGVCRGSPMNCNDNVACTTDRCFQGNCLHDLNDAICNNGLFCDGVETCHLTLNCQPGTPPNCNDGVSCTNDTCNESADRCDHTPVHTTCSNGAFCDGAEICNPALGCRDAADPCAPPLLCNELNDTCVQCLNNGHCLDTSFCNGQETCNAGACVVPGNPCSGVTPVCCEATDSCRAQCCTNLDCPSNGLFCDGPEVCSNGICVSAGNPCSGGTPLCCEDIDVCAAQCCSNAQCQAPQPPCEGGQTCNRTNGLCATEPDGVFGTPCEAEGNLCTIDHCNGAGSCVLLGNRSCQAAVPPCEGGETCNPATGNCDANADGAAGTVCERDGNLCTNDRCNGSGTCAFVSNVPCQAAVPPCEGGALCQPGTGQCVNQADAPLSTECERDGDRCTNDHCNGTGQCVFLSSVTCQAADPPCEGGELCNSGTGLCDEQEDADVTTFCESDGDLCTVEHCDGTGQCVFLDDVICQAASPPCEGGQTCNSTTGDCDLNADAAVGTACEREGNLCTIDRCNGAGVCVASSTVVCPGSAGECDAGTHCDPDTGSCVNDPDPPVDTPCDTDDDLCTIEECDGNGSCVLVGNVTCQTAVLPCEGGAVCDPDTGACVAQPDGALGTSCEAEGNLCTIDHCNGAGSCVLLGNRSCQAAVPPCEGGETCNPGTGNCVANADGAAGTVCERDGNLCTNDRCNGSGTCAFVSDVPCQAANPPCEGGALCQPGTGQCVNQADAPLSTECERDGDQCTIDHCNGTGLCVFLSDVTCQAPDPPCEGGELCNSETGLCDEQADADVTTLCESDGDLCTVEHCDGTGQCVFLSNVVCQAADPPCEGGETCNSTTGDCDLNADAAVGTACEREGNLCTIDRCNGSGVCVFGSNVPCQAAVPPCEGGELCDPGSGLCEAQSDAANGIGCDSDDDLCTIEECNGGGSCVPVDTVTCQAADPPCEGGETCNSTTGDCDANDDATAGMSCEADGDLCTIDECDGNGTCSFEGNVPCQAANPPCEGGETCNPATGACDANDDASLKTPCDRDGDECTIDQCNGNGSCVALDTVDCPASTGECDAGAHCNPDTGQCVHDPDPLPNTPCDTDNDQCTIEVCDGNGSCVGTGNVTCQSANPPCEGGETCNPATGACDPNLDGAAGTVCERDANLCTDDRCDGSGECLFNSTVTCQAADPPCEGGETCNQTTGACDPNADPGSETACEADGDLCTIDACNGAGGCVTVSTVVCTGEAAGIPNICEAGSSCNPSNGNCEDNQDPPAGTACDTDSSQCTNEQCNGTGSCLLVSTVTCQAASPPCEAGETCNPATGNCVANTDPGSGTSCNDGNSCTAPDGCNGAGACVGTNLTGACNDLLHCTVNDTCINGTCVGVDPRLCPENTHCDEDLDTCIPD